MDVIEVIITLALRMGLGALFGLIPFFVGRAMGKPGWGSKGLCASAVCGLWNMQLLAVIVFVVIILVSKSDTRTIRTGNVAPAPAPYQQKTQPVVQKAGILGLYIACISGPFTGRSYRLDSRGVLIGRDPSCTVRFPEETPGVSHRHCMVRLEANGMASLIDLGSTYGTFLSDGRQLPKDSPTPIAPGTRFYLASTGCMFQLGQG